MGWIPGGGLIAILVLTIWSNLNGGVVCGSYFFDHVPTYAEYVVDFIM
jgi:hypothetical protein